jgi:hypothetical protein
MAQELTTGQIASILSSLVSLAGLCWLVPRWIQLCAEARAFKRWSELDQRLAPLFDECVRERTPKRARRLRKRFYQARREAHAALAEYRYICDTTITHRIIRSALGRILFTWSAVTLFVDGSRMPMLSGV